LIGRVFEEGGGGVDAHSALSARRVPVSGCILAVTLAIFFFGIHYNMRMEFCGQREREREREKREGEREKRKRERRRRRRRFY